MSDLDILYFEQLKTEVQAQFLENNTPSEDNISKWKGIDIIYFQEDLRKKAKGNISEKTFYTYFKNSPVTKLPRIDMLNILSIYAGYDSWHAFKKENASLAQILEETGKDAAELTPIENIPSMDGTDVKTSSPEASEETILQNKDTDNETVTNKIPLTRKPNLQSQTKDVSWLKKYAWAAFSSILVIILAFLGLRNLILEKEYTYCFTDSDRAGKTIGAVTITVFKDNESPLLYTVKPGECFVYTTKEDNLRMSISSPFYESLEINRNLEDAPEKEVLRLKPDDYKMAVYYFSRKDMTGKPDEQLRLRKEKQQKLNTMISDNATIYQVYDSDIYGIETMNKQNYITLVTTPTTALKNLNVLEMKKENGKIISIKFKISTDEKAQ